MSLLEEGKEVGTESEEVGEGRDIIGRCGRVGI